ATARSSRATTPSPPGESRCGALKLSNDGFDSDDDWENGGGEWRHGGVVRLEPDPRTLDVEAFDGRLAVDHRDDDLTVVGRRPRLDDDQVAVEDRPVDHRVAFDPQHEAAGPRHPRCRQDELVF